MARGVVITGASRGIGRAIALELARHGYSLLLVARRESDLKSLVSELGSSCSAECFVADVTSLDAGARIRDAALHAFGPPWALVNNAGLAESAPLAKTEDELIQRHMELNFLAPMRLMRAVMPRMAEAGCGRVVNLCSTAALAGYPYVSAYCASKHALLGATRALAREFAQKGITVNAICPGYVRTEMFEQTVANIARKSGLDEVGAEEKLKRLSPQVRVYEAAEVAAAAAYLLSDAAAGVNGQALSIDGAEIEH
ncbi:MAG: SDR family oxidoreductase [Planctomycetes bacterium]|nr:SDR family oxidoreductase [Planctomycetota bacterium]